MGKKTGMALGFLNGLIGDYLARTKNGLATPMECVVAGAAVPVDGAGLAAAYPEATPRVAIFVHGLMCSETIWDFATAAEGTGGDTQRDTKEDPKDDNKGGVRNYGTLLARDFGYTPVCLRYNSGLAIPDLGAELARWLQLLVDSYPVPVEEILLVGYSMGGLVVRSACHVASETNLPWLPLVRRAIYVGTPHLGAPMERVGRVVARVLQSVDDPYTRLIADIANLRSDGVKDLGDADLRHEDRARRRPSVTLRDKHHPVPLLPEITHYLIAATLSNEPWLADLFGDAVVPLRSATAGAAFTTGGAAGAARRPDAHPTIAPGHIKILPGLSHIALAHHEDVYAQIHAWCEEAEKHELKRAVARL